MKVFVSRGVALGAILAGLSMGMATANAEAGLPLQQPGPADVASGAATDVTGIDSLSGQSGRCISIGQLTAGSSVKG
ncbi:hypothetical protein [Nocardia sp. NPDC004722]